MGSRGPAPTPMQVKLRRGETRPSRVNYREPRPRGGLPRLPLDMSPTAKTIWRRVLREMGESGVISAVDADVLRAYCEAVSRYIYAAMTLESAGPLVVARGTGARRGELVKNPLHQVVRDEALLLRTFARELGLAPSARAGLETPAARGGMFEELDRILPVRGRLRVADRDEE